MMKPFWLGLLGSFVGFMLLGAMAFYTDIFTIDRDGVPKFRVSDAGKITVGATESYVNLVIQNDEVSSEADNKVDITADVLTVEGIRLENMAVSANIETSGAGGLDTGTETIDPVNTTWHYIWVITNNDGSARNGLLSLSSTSPTMPSGYTKKRRVGAVGNTTVAGNFLQFAQEGNLVSYLAGQRALSNGVATSYTAVSCESFIPPTSRRGMFHVVALTLHNAAGVSFSVSVRPTGSTSSTAYVMANLQSEVANLYNAENVSSVIPTNATQQIDYKINNVPNGDGGAIIDVIGYYDRI